MITLPLISEAIAAKRRTLRFSQAALAKQARVGHSTLDALENGRLGELGFSKIVKLLTVLGLELDVRESAGHRATMEELVEEDRDDQGLDRQR